jgi:hypothetical protein
MTFCPRALRRQANVETAIISLHWSKVILIANWQALIAYKFLPMLDVKQYSYVTMLADVGV